MNLPLAYGYFDDLIEHDAHVRITGWMLLPDGPFDAIDLVVAGSGARVGCETFELPRLGAACPWIPNAARGAFGVSGGFPALGPDDTLEATFVGKRGGKDVAGMSFGYHRRPTKDVFPPGAVMQRATGSTSPRFWLVNGMKDANDTRRYLAPHVRLDAVRDILDWGCGAGRVTRHIIDRFPKARVRGADIDREAAEWADANLGGEFTSCGLAPPLPYDDASFDLITSFSVFTHLRRADQAAWLDEMRRLLRPGGVLVATTHGTFAGRWLFPDADEFRRVFADAFYDGFGDDALGDVASADYYRATYQTIEYTRAAWAAHLDVQDVVEGGLHNLQDVWILRRPA